MRRSIVTPLALCCALAGLPLSPERAAAQQADLPLERILKPFAEYDPFEKPPPAPQYFPDEVERRVRDALLDSLTERREALADHVRFFAAMDAELQKERGTITGLTGHVRDLLNGAIREREPYLEAQRKALSSASPEEKKLIEARLRSDELTRAEELLRASRANRWGAILNRLLGSVDLLSVLSGSYIGAAVDSTVGGLLELSASEMPIEERRALTLYLEHLKRYPNDPNNPRVQEQAQALQKKLKAQLVRRQMELAQEALKQSEPDRALFHYELATFIDPASRPAREGLEKTALARKQKDQARKQALAVAPRASAAVPTERPELLYALSLRDPAEIEAQARLAGEGDATMAEVVAVALEIKGRHEEAKKLLEEIARTSQEPHAKKRAELLLGSAEYNLLAQFDAARSRHRLESVKYVLLGEDLLKRNLLYGAAPLIAGGPAGATSLAAANVIMIGTNLFHLLSTNPISYESVIDKGVEYIRNHPQSDSASDVYQVLAEAYEQSGRYDKAIAYYQLSGKATEKQLGDLKEKAAGDLIRLADKSASRAAKEAYLKAVLDHYPESAAAKEALRKLSALTKAENQGLRMSKKFLREHPELYGRQGLRLKPTLFDGDLSNMELADQGINLLNDRELLLRYQTPWGIQTQTYTIDRETSERFQIALRSKNYEVALADVDSRAKGSPGGFPNLPLPLLRGQPQKKGEGSEEATLSLVREATGAASGYPTVLDHQLLSESEKEGGVKWRLPEIRGSVSASRFDLSGTLPAGLGGNRLSVGADSKSPFAGIQLPVPLVQGFIPVDFLLQGAPGRFSIYPKIQLRQETESDSDLYR